MKLILLYYFNTLGLLLSNKSCAKKTCILEKVYRGVWIISFIEQHHLRFTLIIIKLKKEVISWQQYEKSTKFGRHD